QSSQIIHLQASRSQALLQRQSGRLYLTRATEHLTKLRREPPSLPRAPKPEPEKWKNVSNSASSGGNYCTSQYVEIVTGLIFEGCAGDVQAPAWQLIRKPSRCFSVTKLPRPAVITIMREHFNHPRMDGGWRGKTKKLR